MSYHSGYQTSPLSDTNTESPHPPTLRYQFYQARPGYPEYEFATNPRHNRTEYS